jgi:predicted Co/Zn/Cd cation transporter (cation efflux family)
MLGVAMNINQLSDLEAKFQWLMATALSLGVSVDVIVAFSMCYCLWNMRVSGVAQWVVTLSGRNF